MKPLAFSIAILLLGSIAMAEEFPAVQVYEKTAKSVVLILSQFEGKQSSVGAGSLITRKGTILTSAHVVVDKEDGKPAALVQVFVKPDKVTGDYRRDFTRRYTAVIAVYDSDLDLAVLKIPDFQDDIEPLLLARADEIRIGEEVVAIGHPEQGGFWTLTYGRISAVLENQSNVAGRDVYQTDTNVNRGNSGGPLLDRRGHLVGVTANIARVGAGNMPITGVNFAVKSVVASQWMEKSGYPAAYWNASQEAVAPPEESTQAEEKASTGKEDTPPVAAPPARPKKADSSPTMQAQTAKEQSRAPKEDRILTPKRPYRLDKFLAEVERDMSDMMEEMRGKIRQ